MKKYFLLFMFNLFCITSYALSISFADNLLNAPTQNSQNIFTIKMLGNLKAGKTNSDVKFLQKTLNDFGYYESDSDNPVFSGKFDNNLTDSIKDFQKSNEIKISGIVDEYTIKTLNEFLRWERKQIQDQSQTEINKNPYIDNVETADNYFNIKSPDANNTYVKESAFSYYAKSFPGLSVLGKAVDGFFGYKKPVKQNSNLKFTIWDCLRDYKCSHAK